MTNHFHGQQFGRLTTIRPTEKRQAACIIWLCRCECGNLTETRSDHLKSGTIKSCGCLQQESRKTNNLKHGSAKKGIYRRLYRIWGNMKKRCYCASIKEYHRYGGRGITVCPEWKNNFLSFRFWAMSSGYQDNLTIDRINNDGNYQPDNCQWLSRAENARKGARKIVRP